MSYIIHILLLDGKILCINYEELSTKSLINHLCKYLNLQRPNTLGLLYRNSRGALQWLEHSKLILDHDIATENEFIPLIFKIRHVPHHVCYNESNCHQLFLQSTRLLKQKWFTSQVEIHSQLVALYILFKYGNDLNESEINDAIIHSHLSMVDHVSNENLFYTVINAYSIYKTKLNSMADYMLKFLQLTMKFPIFNSKLFIVTDSKNQKIILGINSLDLTLFHLEQFHNPIIKYKFSDIENVMHRHIRIIIDLKYPKNALFGTCSTPLTSRRSTRTNELNYLNYNEKNRRSLTPSRYFSENEMVTLYALSPHQSENIYSEIQASWAQFRETSTIYRIPELMKNSNFNESLNRWLHDRYSEDFKDTMHFYHSDSVDMILEQDSHAETDIEIQFGEVDMCDTELYQKFYQTPSSDKIIEPKPDLDQLVAEETRLKEALKEKMIQLHESFVMEEKLTGIMPKEFLQYFPNGLSKFQRNSKNSSLLYHQHRGCAASVRNKFISDSGNYLATGKYDFKNSISSNSIHSNSSNPAINIKSSHSVTDLSALKIDPRFKSGSNSSVRSYEEAKHHTMHKSSSNLFFGDSPRFEFSPRYKQNAIIKSKSQSNNFPYQMSSVEKSQHKTRLYNSISDHKNSISSPRSEIIVSRSSNQSNSTHSSPLINHSMPLLKRFNRSYDRQ